MGSSHETCQEHVVFTPKSKRFLFYCNKIKSIGDSEIENQVKYIYTYYAYYIFHLLYILNIMLMLINKKVKKLLYYNEKVKCPETLRYYSKEGQKKS